MSVVSGSSFKLFTTLALADNNIKPNVHRVSFRSLAEEAEIKHDVLDLVNEGAIIILIDDLATFLSSSYTSNGFPAVTKQQRSSNNF